MENMVSEQSGGTGEMATSSEAGGSAHFVGEDGSFSEGWVERLPADLGEARESFTKFRSVGELAKSYHGLEQLLGRKAQAVVVPNEKSSVDEIAAYRRAVGVPERVEDYMIRPEALPEGVAWNDDLARPFAEIAHRHNIPPGAMRELVTQQAEMERRRSETLAEMAQERLEQGHQSLRQAWGSSYDRNLGMAAKAAGIAGVDPRSPGFTDPEVVKAFARLAGMLSEDHFVPGTASSMQGGGERARDIMTNSQHPLYRKYQDGDAETVDLVRGLLQRG